jgi:hypothetical protein
MYMMVHLRAVTQGSRSFSNEKEVERRSLYNEVGRVARVNGRRDILEVELAGTRAVEMARRLVHTRVECKAVHVEARITRSDYLRAAKLVRNVTVKEFSRELAEEINAMSLEAESRDVTSLILDVKLGRGTDHASSSKRRVGDRTIAPPVLHVRVNNRCLAGKSIIGERSSSVGNHLETELNILNRPLELYKMDAIRALVTVLRLVAMYTYKRESNAIDEDVMYLREEEKVVDVKVERADLRRRESRGMERRGSTRVNNRPVDVASLREAERNETLAIRYRDGREGKASILVEPEELGDPEVKIRVRRLVSLVAVEDLRDRVARYRSRRYLRIRDSRASITAAILTHAAVPSSALILRDTELTVEDIRVARVAIKKVRVDLEASLIEETLARVLAVAVEDYIRSSGRRTRVRGRGRRDDNVSYHISKEITILRDRDLYLRAKRYIVGRYLEVLERDGNIRLEVRVYKENVRALKVRERRVDISLTRGSATSLDSSDVVTKRLVTDKHLVHATIVRY